MGNFKEKTFVNFEVLLLIAKVFSANFRGVPSFSDTREHFTEVFFHEKFPPIHESVSHHMVQV